MAVDLALSVKFSSQLPVAVVSDTGGCSYFRKFYSCAFDQIILDNTIDEVSGSERFVRAKIAAIKHSPYRKSLFFDADVVCVRDVSALFDLIKAESFIVLGRLHHSLETCKDIVHNGVPVTQLFEHFGLSSYTHCFNCAFFFDNPGARRLVRAMEEGDRTWRPCFAPIGDNLYDEVLLGLVGPTASLTYYEGVDRLYQTQDPRFRWSDSFLFVHSSPMRLKEAANVVMYVLKNRRRFNLRGVDAIYWAEHLLARRAVVLGRGRRFAAVVSVVREWIQR
ncbi:MAG TPA: hypothetical protein DDZ51_25715 [Planctomycetaceae bacterium]|nr:hypothetical protein [Planctomycetaceae bacterium]